MYLNSEDNIPCMYSVQEEKQEPEKAEHGGIS